MDEKHLKHFVKRLLVSSPSLGSVLSEKGSLNHLINDLLVLIAWRVPRDLYSMLGSPHHQTKL